MTTLTLEKPEVEVNKELLSQLRDELRSDFEEIATSLIKDINQLEEDKKKELKRIDEEMTLAEFVKTKRKENGYTLETLSNMIDCSVVYLHQIEKGKCKNISMKVFRNICNALNYSADNLLEFLILED